VFQVLDPVELNLDIDGPRLFEDLETRQKIYADPTHAASDFVRQIEAHNADVQAVCKKLGAAFERTVTSQPLELVLSGFLHARRASR